MLIINNSVADRLKSLLDMKLKEIKSIDSWFSLSSADRLSMLSGKSPIIIKGMAAHWPLVEHGKASFSRLSKYLLNFDSGSVFEAMIAAPKENGRFFYTNTMDRFNFDRMKGYLTDALSILEAFQGQENPAAFYIGSKNIAEYLPGLENQCGLKGVPSDIPPNIWLGNAVKVATHNDKLDNVACVAVGRRRFTLFPPNQKDNLYVTDREDTPGGRPISIVDLSKPDFIKYPKFKDALASAQVAELNAGDALYIPKYWWHNVESLADVNILVNFWWQGSAPTFN